MDKYTNDSKLSDISGDKYAEFMLICNECDRRHRSKCKIKRRFKRSVLCKYNDIPDGISILDDWTIECEFFNKARVFDYSNPELINFDKWFKNNYADQGECDECENGKLECAECYGEGMIECNCCGSNTECDECNEGYILCDECDGTNIERYHDIRIEYDERVIQDKKLYEEMMKNNDKTRGYDA